MKKLLLAVAGVAVLAGCSKTNDYKPEVGASGEDIFKAACASCHEVNDQEGKSLSAMDVEGKVAKGSMAMPAFPNIVDAELKSLSEYVATKNLLNK